MNLIQEISNAAIAKLRTAWGLAGSLLMFISPLVSLAFRGQVPPEFSAILPYAVLFAVAVLLFLAWLSSYIWRTYIAPDNPWPNLDTVHYWAIPYNPDIHLFELSSLAQKEFAGDTMSAEVVRHAIASGCAVGVRVTNDVGQDVGFFDVYRLGKDAMLKWLDGTLSEPDLKRTDFEPLSNHEGDQKTLELIVGAIYINRETRRKEPGLAFQLAEVAQDYFWKVCIGWDEIRLYSTIFGEQGKGLASLYGFSKSVYMEHRQGAGARHDVWVRTLQRSDPPRVIRGLGGRHNVILELKHA